MRADLDAIAPGLREKMVAEKKAALSPEEQAALDADPLKRTPQQAELVYQATGKIEVTDRELAERIGKENPDMLKHALLMAGDLERENQRLRFTINYKADSNYDYWYTRAKMEQTPNALAAREAMFNAQRTFRQGDPFGARKTYEDGFAKWRLVFDEFPEALANESSTGDDLIQYILQYRNVLDQMDEELGEDFPLWDVVERFDNEQKLQEELNKHFQRIGRPTIPTPADAAEKAASEKPAEAKADAGAEATSQEAPATEQPKAEAKPADATNGS